MKKFVFIFISTLLIVSVLAVPCFATNEGTYGHYISAGNYRFIEVLTLPANTVNLSFDFVSNDRLFNEMWFYVNDSSLNYFPGTVNAYVDGWVNASYRDFQVLEGFYIYDSNTYLWWLRNVVSVGNGYNSSILDEFLSAFTFVGQWISGAASDLTAMFWTGSELTFVGILVVSALAFAVSFLIIGLISRFLRFRG